MPSSDDLKKTIRRNKLFGFCAADKLGFAGGNAEAYSDALATRSRAPRVQQISQLE
jgi:hypothetical protein